MELHEQNEYLFFKLFRNVVINRLIFSFITGTGKKYKQIKDSTFIIKNGHYGLLKDKLHNGGEEFSIYPEDYFECVKYIQDLETFKLFITKCIFGEKELDESIPFVDLCANSGKTEFLKYLKEIDKFQYKYPLDLACNSGSLECIKYLESVNHSLPITNQSLDNASKGGYLDIVNYLIQNKKDIIGKNALGLAIENGHLEVIKVLENEKPNLIGKHKQSIREAAKKGYFNVIEHLLNENYNGFKCSTADAAAMGGHLDLVKLLDKFGYRATSHGLNIAAKKNYVDICKYLVDLKIKHDENCIRNSILNGNLELLKYFRDKLPSFECSVATFNYACYTGNLEIVQYLSNIKVKGGSLAYHDASVQGHLDIIKYLNNHRPDISCPPSAAKMSVYYSHKDLVSFYIKNLQFTKLEMISYAQSYNLLNMVDFIHNI